MSGDCPGESTALPRQGDVIEASEDEFCVADISQVVVLMAAFGFALRYFSGGIFDGCAWLCAELETRKWFLLPTRARVIIASNDHIAPDHLREDLELDIFSDLNSVDAVFHFLMPHRAKSSCVCCILAESLSFHTVYIYMSCILGTH